MGRAKHTESKDKFQTAVEYLTEYSGVTGAVIANPEGLVIAHSGNSGFEPDSYAALSLQLIESVQTPLQRVTSPDIDSLTVKTASCWVTVARTKQFLLVVAAERQTDDLLNIRITRSFDMISSYLREKYSSEARGEVSKAKTKKSREDIHV
jgi:predicted regulator of Ras-like GTPase activity (Roadblock/LC7/MglB family)